MSSKKEASGGAAAVAAAPAPESPAKNGKTAGKAPVKAEDKSISKKDLKKQRELEKKQLEAEKKAAKEAEKKAAREAKEEAKRAKEAEKKAAKEAKKGGKKEEPAKPKKEEPAKPKKEEPAKPKKEEPAKPKKEEPAKPKKEEPAKKAEPAKKEEPAKASSSSSVNVASGSSSSSLASSSSGRPSAAAAPKHAPVQAVPSTSAPTEAVANADSGVLTHTNLLCDARFADVNFVLPNGGKQVNAHSFVLGVRCAKLSELANDRKKKRGKKHAALQVEIKDDVDPAVFNLVLEFIYGDCLDLTKQPPANVLLLCVAAHKFGLQRLARLCEDHIKATLNMDNLFQMLSGAAHFKENKVKSFCLNFAHKHIKEFVAREKDVHELGVPLFQEAMELSLNEYQELPEESEPLQQSTLNEDFKKLYEQTAASKVWADGFVMVQNKKVPFHKALLAGHSVAFRKELQPRGEEDLTEAFELGDMKVESFHSMLKFVYYGDTTLNASTACDLAPFAKRWQMSELQRIAENTINGNVGTDNVLSVLKVAYLKENMERDEMKQLRAKCLSFITEHISDVDLDALNTMEIRVSVDILRAWKATQA